MKSRSLLLSAAVTTVLLCATSGLAQVTTTCTPFTVVVEDALHNVKQGLSANDLKWYKHKIARKYRASCYAAPNSNVPVVLYIRITPNIYHGTRIVKQTSTESNPVDGTITDQDGNISQINGTEQTTSTTSTAVPYSFEYGIYTLSVERRHKDGTYSVAQTFQQKGIYSTYMGIPLGGRGHHPAHAVIEDAVKWINSGGLTDASQGSVRPLASIADPHTPSLSTGSTFLSRTLARAEAGDVKAQDGLGALYAMGDGVPQDYAEAAIWFRKAAEQGDGYGESSLGTLYEQGLGLPKDSTLAFKWFIKAANHGYPDAEWSVGLDYYLGSAPVARDYSEAYFWLDLAAASEKDANQKNEIVKYRDSAASKLSGSELSKAQKRATEWFTENSLSK